MNLPRAAAALLAALLLCGCAAFNGQKAQATPDAAAADKQGLRITIEAPADLKALLERYLDVVRLGRVSRDEVDDSEWARLLDAAPGQVRELLQTEGYFSPQVTLVRDSVGNGVLLKVDPGQRVKVGRVTLEVEGELERNADAGDAEAVAALAQWRKGWTLGSGKDFRNPAWSEAKAAALAALRAAGYATATWTGTGAEIDPATATVRLFVVADSGPLFRYGSLEVEGLQSHDADTVLNLVNARRGTPVTEAMLLDAQERLQKSGLFENASVTLDPDVAHAAESRIVVRLREAPLQVYTLGAGISANTGPRASAEQSYRRVFGYAALARNKVEWGKLHQFWQGEISTHPGTGLYRNLIGGTVDNLVSDSDTVLSQSIRLGRTQEQSRIERLYYVEFERSRRTTVNEDRSNAFALSINYHGVWRNLDSVVLPTEGYSFNGQFGAGLSRGTDAEPGPYTRLYARLTGYLPVGRSWYTQGRVEAGQVFLGSRMVVPDSQKFRAGGDDSVRGYSYRSLGPLVDGVVGGGLVMYTASAEVARPVLASMPSLWGALFADAGNAANSYAHLNPAVGVGIGARWRSPVGPLRIDWAWGVQTRKSRLHFSVGIAF